MEAGELGCQRSQRDLARLSSSLHTSTDTLPSFWNTTIRRLCTPMRRRLPTWQFSSTGTDKGAYDRLSMPAVDLSRQLGSSADLVAPILWLLIDGS